MESEVDGIIEETIREMESELRYVSIDSVQRTFLTPALIDAKRIVGWTSLLLGGGGTVAAAILTLSGVELAAGPVGWVAAGIGLAGGIALLFRTEPPFGKRKNQPVAHIDKGLQNMFLL